MKQSKYFLRKTGILIWVLQEGRAKEELDVKEIRERKVEQDKENGEP
jgi:hypothetical protein